MNRSDKAALYACSFLAGLVGVLMILMGLDYI